jgi:ComF family protein
MHSLHFIFRALGQVFFPHHCMGCGMDLENRKTLLCFSCINNLPKTNFTNIVNNPTEKIFNGRIDLDAATSVFYFTKGSLIQHMIHELKYKNNAMAGKYLGKMLGKEIKNSPRFKNIDAIIPMPMHKKKERRRGYNQAELIANGVAEELNVDVAKNALQKIKQTDTQTKKQRWERWKNTEEVFLLQDLHLLENKHVLLIDDVVTTGASIEACGIEMLKTKGIRLSVATIAIA